MAGTPDRTTVGFIGLGAMGQPMALNLVRSWRDLVVFDIDTGRAAPILELGGTVATSARDVARQARIVLSMVDTEAQTEDVLFGAHGIADAVQAEDKDPAAAVKVYEALTGISLERPES